MNKQINNTNVMEASQGPKAQEQTDTTTGLFVSLYLIVLAFFVVMNSISNQEQHKVEAATESVTRAFKNPFEPEADFVDVSANQDAATPNDEFYAQIQGIFASLVGFEGKFPTEGGYVVKVSFEASKLFASETAHFKPEQQVFLKQLATFLSISRVSEKREIEVVVSSGKSLPRGPKYWEEMHILRAGAFVHYLKKLGVAEDQLSIGIVRGKRDQVTITFLTRERNHVDQDLKGHVEKNPAAAGGGL